MIYQIWKSNHAVLFPFEGWIVPLKPVAWSKGLSESRWRSFTSLMCTHVLSELIEAYSELWSLLCSLRTPILSNSTRAFKLVFLVSKPSVHGLARSSREVQCVEQLVRTVHINPRWCFESYSRAFDYLYVDGLVFVETAIRNQNITWNSRGPYGQQCSAPRNLTGRWRLFLSFIDAHLNLLNRCKSLLVHIMHFESFWISQGWGDFDDHANLLDSFVPSVWPAARACFCNRDPYAHDHVDCMWSKHFPWDLGIPNMWM